MNEDSSVRVALRIRPQIPREIIDMCRVCTSVAAGEPQVWLGNDKAFTFDYVFDMNSMQSEIFVNCVQTLIDGCLEGFNATVLAYGQTGSGKTYTMGTGFDMNLTAEEFGIIPRAVEHLFEGIEAKQRNAREIGETPPEFKIVCQFMELYNEEVIDLFDTTRDSFMKGKKSSIRIHEDAQGSICTVGLTSKIVNSKAETIQCLKIGALSRTTASTQMNVQSSRSHAVFTLHIKQHRIVPCNDPESEANDMNEFETLTAKFHFVDLAGSERLKRTGATGERAKEGISINCGLLALGNVISALGDKLKRGSHVPYRDSKLTRLLQDSLGGNSRTVMIACISPSDRDFMETLNTLKYANRARNIKNRITINQDKTSKTINSLRIEIQQLQLELMEYKQGKRMIVDGVESINDMYHENTMLQTENNALRTRIKAMQETIEQLTVRNTQLLSEKACGNWIGSNEDGGSSDMTQMVQGYLKEIEEFRAKLLESENTCQVLRRSASRAQSRAMLSPPQMTMSAFELGLDADDSASVDDLLGEAKMDVLRLKRKGKKAKLKTSESEKDGEDKSDDDTETEDDNLIDNDVSSESDSEEKENMKDEEDLAALTCEISIKQKLIEELEKSQRRLQTMRLQYEEKVLQLQNQIRSTQEERDKVLANYTTVGNQPGDKVKKVKEEYEKKLNNLQNEMKKLQEAKKRHAQLVRSQSQYEQQLKSMKADLTEMKQSKVRLMKKMKEEALRHKEAEARRAKEIAQLRKESRVRANQVRTLEADKKLKESILKRKQEEISAMRKFAKPMSDRVAGRMINPRMKQNVIGKKQPFSPKLVKHKWQTVEKEINKVVLNRQTIISLEKDMERWLEERNHLTHNLDRCVRKKDRAVLERKNEVAIRDLDDEMENLKANIDYIQENISECQTNIMQMEEPKTETGGDTLDPTIILSGLGYEETKYLLEKLLMLTLNQGVLVTQKEGKLKEMEAKMEQLTQNNDVQHQLLDYLYAQHGLEGLNFFPINGQNDEPRSSDSSRSVSPMESNISALGDLPQSIQPSFSSDSLGRRSMKDKVRRRTATTDELLFFRSGSGEAPAAVTLPIPGIQEEDDGNTTNIMQRSLGAMPPSFSSIPLPRVPSAPGSLKAFSRGENSCPSSPQLLRKSQDRLSADLSPRPHRKTSYHFNSPGLTRQMSTESGGDMSPPPSPTTSRRVRDDNVFSRLTSRTSLCCDTNPDRGVISPYAGKMRSGPLVCTHVAEGHSKAVLSVAATEDLLFSASKDRTVKVWDLRTGQELHSLENHPNNVVVVKYAQHSQLVLSVASSFIKVWDLRESPVKCIKTLSSSGLSTSGSQSLMNPIRPQHTTTKESQINDIAINQNGTTLFSASSNIVRVWDLRKFSTIGKLGGSHQSTVMCLAVDESRSDSCLVITGSKDHYIKVFSVIEGIGGMHTPKFNLEPPHYDGIESLAITGKYLFSGSRDMCIKKWDLNENELKQSVNQAHKDWICGMCVLPGNQVLLSGCRGGFVKLWSVENCAQICEIKAHASPINAVTSNSVSVFTASSDGTIGIWRLKGNSADFSDFSDI